MYESRSTTELHKNWFIVSVFSGKMAVQNVHKKKLRLTNQIL